MVLKQLSEEIRGKEKRETQVLEELAGLRDSLLAEEQTRTEVSEERERLTKQLGDMDAALQVPTVHAVLYRCKTLVNSAKELVKSYSMTILGRRYLNRFTILKRFLLNLGL